MEQLNLTTSLFGIASVVVFLAAYVLAVLEETTHMRKSKPVMLAAGLIWAMIGICYAGQGLSDVAHEKAAHIIE
ncbi:hypothetical protein ACTTAI_05810 [Rhodobacter capsulatus]|uniref:hypothetical protein n=1 Tax=Rhodobacter capsulatus TaxID=1061 RepID=UPI00402511D2